MTEKDLIPHFNRRFKDFRGDITQLERAIGCFVIGRQVGWKVMLLVHDRKTIKLYEELLGLDFKRHLKPEGPLAHKSLAWQLVKKVSSFWKAVKGEIPGVRTPEVE